MKTKYSDSVISGVLVGLMICILVGAAAISFFAWMISEEYIQEKNIGYVCTGILVTSTVIGTFAAINKAKQKTFLTVMLTASAYLLVMIAINALFMDGVYDGVAVTALCVAGSSAFAALLSIKRKRPPKYRMKK